MFDLNTKYLNWWMKIVINKMNYKFKKSVNLIC